MKIHSIAMQVATIKALFPELADASYDEDMATSPLPSGAQGLFAIPRHEVVAPTYREALDKVLALMEPIRGQRFYNSWNLRHQDAPIILRHYEHAVACIEKLEEAQKGRDILIIPAQMGLLHQSVNGRWARKEMRPNEFGLGAFAVGTYLLTHPQLHRYNTLPEKNEVITHCIICPGDEDFLSPTGNGTYTAFPCFWAGSFQTGVSTILNWESNPGVASASGFVPDP